ncbi:MAG: prolyl oligopeptidase family serine peptidase [Gemmatimonadaceae bacterium]|nr:prolyl oligopeptidase family serine peptidase [Gemmatimonadaceae bacterium]
MIAAILLALATFPGGSVRADSLWSPSLGLKKQYIVYLPASYGTDTARRYPVAFYLHGLWGNEWDWVKFGKLDVAMDSLTRDCGAPGVAGAECAREMIVVMPDGDDGWYTTWNTLVNVAECRRNPARKDEDAASYCVPWPHYDDYIARDLVAHVDSTYRTIPDRSHRGIAGLSMGGYGAVALALQYPDVFAAAASHSGVLSPLYGGPRPFSLPVRYATDMKSLRAGWGRFWPLIYPAFGRDTAGWAARDPARLAKRLLAGRRRMPELRFDSGWDDKLVIDGNRAFHAELSALGIQHRFMELPGAHDWDYWKLHVPESLTWLASIISAPVERP